MSADPSSSQATNGKTRGEAHVLQGAGRTYKLGKTLGKGQYGKVKLATILGTGQKVAIKLFSKAELSKKEETMLKRELSIIQYLDHPHIVRMLLRLGAVSYACRDDSCRAVARRRTRWCGCVFLLRFVSFRFVISSCSFFPSFVPLPFFLFLFFFSFRSFCFCSCFTGHLRPQRQLSACSRPAPHSHCSAR